MTFAYDFSISIALYNKVELSKKCIESLLKTAGSLSFELLLFNNNSNDQTKDFIENLDFPHKVITHNPANLGFGYAHNENLKKAQGEYFLALNNDLFITEEDFLAKIKEGFTSNKNLALLGFEGGFSEILADGTTAESEKIEYIEGAALTIPKTLAEKHGLFSLDYTMFYVEDVDLSLRYQELGYDIDLIDIRHQHASNSSSEQINPWYKNFCANRNRTLFKNQWKHYLESRNFDQAALIQIDHFPPAIHDLFDLFIKSLKRTRPGLKIYIESEDSSFDISSYSNVQYYNNKAAKSLSLTPHFNFKGQSEEHIIRELHSLLSHDYPSYIQFHKHLDDQTKRQLAHNNQMLLDHSLREYDSLHDKFARTLAEKEDLEKRLEAALSSLSYRIGYWLLTPLRWLKNLLNHQA